MKRRYKIALAVLLVILVIAVVSALLYLSRRGTVETVYGTYLSQHTMDTIYYEDPEQPGLDYSLKSEALEAASEYLLSQEIKPVLWEGSYKEQVDERMELPWVALASNEDGLPTVYFELYVADSQTVIVMETGEQTEPYKGKTHIYTLSEAFDMAYFLSFFEEG